MGSFSKALMDLLASQQAISLKGNVRLQVFSGSPSGINCVFVSCGVNKAISASIVVGACADGKMRVWNNENTG